MRVAHAIEHRARLLSGARRVTNDPGANDYLKWTYHEGWTLNG